MFPINLQLAIILITVNYWLRMGRLSEIEVFVKVAAFGSLVSVAREMKVSSAAISKQLSKLEERLGLQLLNRSTRKVEVTELGEIYLEQCRRVLEEIDGVDALAQQMKSAPKGPLRVLSPPHFCQKFIVPNLPKFFERYPEVELYLEVAERVPDFEAEKIDISIGASASAPESAIQKKIATTSYTFCASPSYLKKNKTPKKPEELANHRCLSHSRRLPNNFFYLKNDQKIRYDPWLYANDAEVLAKMAIQGLGVVQLHHYVVRDAIKQGALKEVLSAYTRKNVPIYVALPSKKHPPLAVRAFVDFMTECFYTNCIK